MKDTVLGEDGPQRKRLSIRLTEYEGTRLLDLRFWFYSAKDREWQRTKKGIMLNRENFICARDTLASHSEKILDWLGIAYLPQHVENYDRRQSEAVECRGRVGVSMSVSSYQETRSPEFFRIASEGGRADVGFNEEHPLYAAMDAANTKDEALQLLAAVLNGFHQAKIRMEDGPISDSELFLSQLEQEWAKNLKAQMLSK
jgi:hypothetical protein